MNFEAVIGIEIHVEMKTKSKMFSSGRIAFGEEANTCVRPLDMAFPGTMPIVNKQAVINAIRVSNALHMKIDHELWFDRKNYFYSDLPKGFQITQQARPIGSEGYLDIELSNGTKKRIGIERLHMEEDTCKQLHMADYSLLDYNRAGTPLVEIVSKPEIRSGEEAMKYVEMIKSIVIFSDVSDGKMEEGSLRCDVNISIRPCGSDKFGTKVEVKNLNSTANVQRAIDFEVKRQTKLLLSGIPVEQETRRFDELKRETVLMRKKTNAVDYKYFVEPNLVPIKLSDEFVENAIRTCPELAHEKKTRYISLGLSDDEANQMLQDKASSEYFDECLKVNSTKAKAFWNWLNGDVLAYLNKNNLSIKDFVVTPSNLLSLIEMYEKGTLSFNQARNVFEKMVVDNKDANKIADELGLKQNSNIDEIRKIVEDTVNEFPQSVIDYKNGKDRAVGFLVGQIMKKTKGKVNPQITSKLVLEVLKSK
ncbi:MAG: Asp-tRNA(Asn)/Glu-tRNA(Gln) amidotransferase subunit GatB [Bacillales bacterium]|nr:Asp-tRNA(Asn)/Glu-tRNA(Gln) amidotransferase subunit GatB [Bacillales bacterium]